MNSSTVGSARTLDGLPGMREEGATAVALSNLRADSGETVVLIHGAIVSPMRAMEMTVVAIRLRQLGYKVVTFCYPSLIGRLTRNAANFHKYLTRLPYEKVHIVAHSMGGVLTREVLNQGVKFGEGRVIALGTPFVECWMGRRALQFFGRWAIGETVFEHIGRKMEPIWEGHREIGVLAGSFSVGVGRLFPTMPKPNDGVVVWEETRLQGITDHVTLDINHFGLLISTHAFYQIAHFLKVGSFARTNYQDASNTKQPVLAKRE